MNDDRDEKARVNVVREVHHAAAQAILKRVDPTQIGTLTSACEFTSDELTVVVLQATVILPNADIEDVRVLENKMADLLSEHLGTEGDEYMAFGAGPAEKVTEQ